MRDLDGFDEMILFGDFLHSIYLILRPLIKLFLHRFTNLCELQVSWNFHMKPQIDNLCSFLATLLRSAFWLQAMQARRKISESIKEATD